MIDICWNNDKYDISRVVYGIVLGSIYLSMPSFELSYHLNISRALMELSSLSYRGVFGFNGQVFMDSIHIISLDERMETSEELPVKRIKPNKKVIGKRYAKRRRRLNKI